MKKFKVAFLCAFIAFLLFYVIAIVKGAENPYARLWTKDDPEATDKELPDEDTGKDDEHPPVDTIEPDNEIEQIVEKELFFLIMGIDGESAFSPSVKGTRTDTMILTKVNFDTGEILMVNLPRDSRVKINGRYDKLNHSHSYGGTKLVMQTIRDFTRLDLDYYVKVDYHIVKSLVDSLGGIEFDVPMDMHYEDPVANPPFKVHLNKGLQTLNGEQALGLLRYRGDMGDITRIGHQQAFLKEAAKQALKLKNIPKLGKFVSTMFQYIDTNLTKKQLASAVLHANKLKPEEMETLVLPGKPTYINGLSYWSLDEEGCRAIFKEHFKDYYVGP